MDAVDVEGAATELRHELVGLGRPERAEGERRYLKSDLIHLGVAVPDVRRVARRWVRANGAADHESLLGLADLLWVEPVHERRLLAIELLAQRPQLLGVGDIGWIESHLRDCRTWALVDPLAGGVVASMACRDDAVLDRTATWATDRDVWVRRSSVLALRGVLREGRGWERFVTRADALVDDPTFWVRKALGWVAREHGRVHPDEVSAWVSENLARLSGVTVREATRHLPDRTALLARWKAAAMPQTRR